MCKSRFLSCAAWLLSLALMSHSAAAAVITIYADSLTGSGHLNGSTVATSTDQHGGTLNATWISRGESNLPERAIRTANGALLDGYTSAFLPISIQEGLVYKLTATVNKTTGNQKFVSIGFARTHGDGLRPFIDNADHKSSAAVSVYSTQHANYKAPDFFAGPGATNPIAADAWTDALRGEQTVSIILDTTGSQWKVQAIVGGIASDVHTYTEAESIAANFKYVGFGSDSTGNNLIKDFSLVVIPEPGTAALTLLGGAMVLLRRRVV